MHPQKLSLHTVNENEGEIMIQLGLLVTMEAKPGKEGEVETFLRLGGEMVLEEGGTVTWYAFRINKNTFGIFDTFENEDGREAHLTGDIAAALMDQAPDLFDGEPKIQRLEILAHKT